MSRLSKLRRNPEQFFRDSRSPLVRFAGAAVARATLGPDRVTDWLDEPLDAIAGAGVPLVSALARAAAARDGRRRRELLARHGHPLVSVVMAAYNAADTIGGAIESVQRQSYAGFELVIVDDNSSDDTGAIADGFAARDERIRVVHSEGQGGAAGARNLGLQAARGQFFAFHDSDDETHPERLERQLAALLRNPTASVCLCNGRRVDDHGEPILVNGRRDYKWVNSMMFPRRVFDRVGFQMKLRVSEDAEYYERIKLAFGNNSELRLFKTLYYAGFSPDSLLFSDGTTEVGAAGGVQHQRSEDAEAALMRIRALHDDMRRGARSYYVAFDSSPA